MKQAHGVTFLELLTVITIIVVLSVMAVSVYNSQIRKSRRADAFNAMMSISLAEARYRGSNAQYGTLAQVWGGVTTSSDGHYSLAITDVTASSYTITATAQGTQANDTANGTSCATLTLSESSGTITQSPSACWPK